MQAMFAALAEYERRIISERTKNAMAAMIRAGKQVGRPTEVDPAAVEYAQDLRDLGYSWTAIASELDAAGYTPPRAARWNRQTVRHMVTGEPWGAVTRRIRAEQAAAS